METISIKDFAKSRSFVQINKTVKTNVNGFPYITFIDASNVAENVYFSKGASASIKAGDDFTAIIKDYEICSAENADGETRMKLCRKGGDRVELDSLFD